MTHAPAATAAAQTLPNYPAWSLALFVATGLWWLGFFIAVMGTREARAERRLYWTGYGGVALLCGGAMLARGWQISAWTVGLVVGYTVAYAILRTDYLRIGGRPFTLSAAAHRRDERERGRRAPVVQDGNERLAARTSRRTDTCPMPYDAARMAGLASITSIALVAD